MARDNYSYQKHRRELAKKKKKEEKMQRKLNKKNAEAKDGAGQVSNGDPLSNNGINPEIYFVKFQGGHPKILQRKF